METADLVAEYVALSRQAKSGPLAADQQQRMQELKGLLLAAQRQQTASSRDGRDDRPAQAMGDWRARR